MVDSVEIIRFFAEFILSEAEGLRMTTVISSPIATQSLKGGEGGFSWFELALRAWSIYWKIADRGFFTASRSRARVDLRL
jgi:hypothetical protein